MKGTEIVKRKWKKWDYLEYNDDYKFSMDRNIELEYHIGKMIDIDYENSGIIIKEIASDMYEHHSLHQASISTITICSTQRDTI